MKERMGKEDEGFGDGKGCIKSTIFLISETWVVLFQTPIISMYQCYQ